MRKYTDDDGKEARHRANTDACTTQKKHETRLSPLHVDRVARHMLHTQLIRESFQLTAHTLPTAGTTNPAAEGRLPKPAVAAATIAHAILMAINHVGWATRGMLLMCRSATELSKISALRERRKVVVRRFPSDRVNGFSHSPKSSCDK